MDRFFAGIGRRGYVLLRQQTREYIIMERRQLRSTNQGEALQLYLSNLAQKCGAEGVVVADESGLVIAGAGAVDLDLLAAHTVCAQLPANDAEVQDLSYPGLTLRVSTLHGSPLPTSEVSAAVGRILQLVA